MSGCPAWWKQVQLCCPRWDTGSTHQLCHPHPDACSTHSIPGSQRRPYRMIRHLGCVHQAFKIHKQKQKMHQTHPATPRSRPLWLLATWAAAQLLILLSTRGHGSIYHQSFEFYSMINTEMTLNPPFPPFCCFFLSMPAQPICLLATTERTRNFALLLCLQETESPDSLT